MVIQLADFALKERKYGALRSILTPRNPICDHDMSSRSDLIGQCTLLTVYKLLKG